MVPLQTDMTLLRAAVLGPLRELACLHARLPIGAPELVLEKLETVQPMLDVRALGDDACPVPVADRLQVPGRRRIDLVRRASAGHPGRVVSRQRVVQELVSGCA